MYNGYFNGTYIVAVYCGLNEITQGGAEHLAHNKRSIHFNNSCSQVWSHCLWILQLLSFAAVVVFVCPYHITFVSWRRGWDIYDSAPDPGWPFNRSSKVHFLLAVSSDEQLYHLPTPRLRPVRAKRTQKLRSPQHLSRPASWIKWQMEPLFKCNFDIRPAKQIQCSGLSDTIPISLVILAKKDMKVSFFHRRAWVELKIVQFRGELLYNIWNH